MGRKKGSTLSPAHRAKISASIKKVWAKYPLPAERDVIALVSTPRVLRAAHKKKISESMKAQWKKRKQLATEISE